MPVPPRSAGGASSRGSGGRPAGGRSSASSAGRGRPTPGGRDSGGSDGRGSDRRGSAASSARGSGYGRPRTESSGAPGRRGPSTGARSAPGSSAGRPRRSDSAEGRPDDSRDARTGPRRDGTSPARREGAAGRPERSGGGRSERTGGARPDRGGSGRPERSSGGRQGRDEAPRRPSRPSSGGPSAGGPRGGGRPSSPRSEHGGRPRRDDRPGRSATPDPSLPNDVDLGELSDDVRRQLQGLAPGNVERVGAHLVMAGRLIDDDPAAALLHAQAARRSGGRIGGVREAVGVAAYRAGSYAEAVSELRAARRLTGRWDLLALEADAERALGRPQRALTLARSPQVRSLDEDVRNELAIVASGARTDLGQPRAAVALLAPLVNRDRPGPDAVRLWYAYAAALLASGRGADAREWFEIVALLDEDGDTDAAERAALLGGAPVVIHEAVPDDVSGDTGPALALDDPDDTL